MNDAHVFKALDTGVNAHGDIVIDGIYSTRSCRYGRMKWITTDYGVGQQLAMYAEYSEGEVALFRKLIRRGSTVLCAGANIGAHCVPFSRIVGPEGKVVAFEPQAFLWPILAENLAVNGCANVEVHHKGLGESAALLPLASADPTMPNNFGGMCFVEDPAIQAELVPVVSIDSLELPALDFVLLDIEGMELPALKGAHETIERYKPILYVEIDKEDKREPIMRYIRDELKYEVLQHLPFLFNPDNYAGNQQNPFGEMRSIMCLGIPT